MLGEEGLIALCVVAVGAAVHILGQGRFAHSVEEFAELFLRAIEEEAQGTATRGGVVDDFGHELIVLAEVELIADTDLTCWVDDDVPELEGGIEFA